MARQRLPCEQKVWRATDAITGQCVDLIEVFPVDSAMCASKDGASEMHSNRMLAMPSGEIRSWVPVLQRSCTCLLRGSACKTSGRVICNQPILAGNAGTTGRRAHRTPASGCTRTNASPRGRQSAALKNRSLDTDFLCPRTLRNIILSIQRVLPCSVCGTARYGARTAAARCHSTRMRRPPVPLGS